MRIYLCTLFGVSRQFHTRNDYQLFQGVVQSKGIALHLLLIIIIFLVRYVCSRRVITQIIALILNTMFPLVALLHADNIDLYMFNQGADSAEEIVRKA